MEQLPRIIDLFPRRILTLVLGMLAGLLLVAGLEGLYYASFHLSPLASDHSVEAFDLDREGTLATWFSSFLYLLCAAVSFGVYAIRKRHVEDYQARYRVWAWAGAVWLLMSMDETGSLHEGFKELMALCSGTRLYGDGSVWWIAAYCIVLLPIGCLIWVEMQPVIGARICLSLTAAFYVVAVLAQLGILLPDSGAVGVMLEEGCEMIGTLCLLLGLCLYARYVIRITCEPGVGKKKGRKGRTAAAKPTKKTVRRVAAKRKARVTEEVEEEEAVEEEAAEEEATEEAEYSEEEEAVEDSEVEEEVEPEPVRPAVVTRDTRSTPAANSPARSNTGANQAKTNKPEPARRESDDEDEEDLDSLTTPNGVSRRVDGPEDPRDAHSARERRKDKKKNRQR